MLIGCWAVWALGALTLRHHADAATTLTRVTLIVLLIPLVGAGIDFWLRKVGLTWLRVFSAITLVGVIADLALSAQGPRPRETSALELVLVGPLASATFLFGRRWGIVAVVICGPIIGLNSWFAHADLRVAISEALLMTLVVFSIQQLTFLAQGVARVAHESSLRGVQLRGSVARRSRRIYERRRWDGLVHDKVLGALQLGYREAHPSGNAQSLAQEALGALEWTGEAHVVDTVEDVARATAERLGLTLTFTRQGHIRLPDVSETLGAAVAEALTNVARHSGTKEAWVHLERERHSVTVTVTDHGRGFDPAKSPQSRAGLKLGIRERMISIGGEARIDSRPGAGTVVTLTWTEHDLAAQHEIAWDENALQPALMAALVLSWMHILVVMVYPSSFIDLGVLMAVDAALLAISIAAVVVPENHRCKPFIALPLLAVPWIMTLDLVDPLPLDNRYFWGGAAIAMLWALSFQRRPCLAPALLIGMAVVDVAAQLTRFGVVHPEVLLWNYGTAGIAVALCLLVRSSLNRLTEQLGEESREMGDLRVAEVEEEEARAETELRRQRLLNTAVPSLQLVAEGVELTPEQRAGLVLTEASTRDWLVAAPLMTPDLGAALTDARVRGARVSVAVRDSMPAADRDRFASLVAEALACAQRGTVLTAQWHAVGARRGSISIVNPAVGSSRRLRDAARRVADTLAVAVSVDEDAILVECDAVEVGLGGGDPGPDEANVPSGNEVQASRP